MARTAPIPNIPAIPGMNPGVFILGGGGGAGGSGGKGGNGSGDGQGAGGANGGDGADGGGRGADACGPGTPAGQGGCPGNHGSGGGQVSAGDPVDVVTGAVFTTPRVDLALPGPLPLRFVRVYNTRAASRDVGLGWGWSHSFAWTITQRRRVTQLHRHDGSTLDFDALGVGDSAVGPEGLVLRRSAKGFELEEGSGLRRRFIPDPASDQRYLLASLSDVFGNAITLHYHQGRLTSIVDSAGRDIRFESDARGHITSLSVRNAKARGQWIRRMTYRYDEQGRLRETEDAERCRWSYEYDEDHRMIRKTDAAGLTFSYRYDAQGRCVETWGTPAGDLGLADGVPSELADGITRAKGVHHCRLTFGDDGYVEVATSLEVERYVGNAFGKVDKAVAGGGGVHTRTYDDYGHVLSYTDPLGATTLWTRDRRGRPLSETDAMGRTTSYERDPDGQLRQVIDPAGGVTTVERSERTLKWTNPIGASWLFVYDERGLVIEAVSPVGGTVRSRYDAFGNLVEQVDPMGRVTRFTYDGLGNLLSMMSPRGGTASFVYNERGEVIAARDAAGERTFRYDGVGNLVAQTDRAGHATHYRYGGAHVLVEARYPDGSSASMRYDREGQLREIENGRGEKHVIERGPRGAVTAERTFDGRRIAYRYDLCGRVIEKRTGVEEVVKLTYNACGELVERAYGDDIDRFELDARGELVRAETPAGVFAFERNEVGWIVAERQEVAGEVTATLLDYDLMGSLVRRRTIANGAVRTTEWTRNAVGEALEIRVDGELVRLSRDAAGRPVRLDLPAGGVIERGYDEMSRRVLQRAVPRGAAAGGGVEQVFGYDAGGRPAAIRDGAEETRFEYDPMGQLAAVYRGGEATRYRYDGAGNGFVAGGRETRAYAAGGRVERSNDVTYSWDGAGRLAARKTDAGLVERYHWKASGLLEKVVRGDSEVSFDYDPLARRIKKRVARVEGGVHRLVSETRFLYDGAELVREIERRASDEGDPVVVERSYVYDEEDQSPLVQRTDVAEGGSLQFILADLTSAPRALVGPDGALRRRIERDAWGRLLRPGEAEGGDVPRLGFEGQYYDAETGLWANRFRYYDAEIGRYISPDPLGVREELNAYRYAVNAPTYAVDPDGLMPFAIIRDKHGQMVTTGGSAGAGGGVQERDARDISEHARPSCAETTALHNLVGHLPRDQRRAEIQRLFNEEGYTIECWDGNAGDYEHENSNSKPMNPCPTCKKMFQDLEIEGQVRAPNRKPKVDRRGSPAGYERRITSPWDRKSTSH